MSAGYHTLAEAFSGWRDSPPHRANMLQSGVTKMGIAASYAPNTKYKVFWALILAAPHGAKSRLNRGSVDLPVLSTVRNIRGLLVDLTSFPARN